MKIGLIFQARANSQRLKNKIFKKIKDKTILELFINKILKTKRIDCVIAATTKNKKDDRTVKIAKKNKLNIFRGSEKNVLSRFYYAAKKFELDLIVRCNADCPFIDAKIIDKMIYNYKKIYEEINNNENFDMNDILRLLKKNPDIMKINYHIEKKQNLILK